MVLCNTRLGHCLNSCQVFHHIHRGEIAFIELLLAPDACEPSLVEHGGSFCAKDPGRAVKCVWLPAITWHRRAQPRLWAAILPREWQPSFPHQHVWDAAGISTTGEPRWVLLPPRDIQGVLKLSSVLPPGLTWCSKPSTAFFTHPVVGCWVCSLQTPSLAPLRASNLMPEHHSNSLREEGWICLNTQNSFFLQFQNFVCSADTVTLFSPCNCCSSEQEEFSRVCLGSFQNSEHPQQNSWRKQN